ncbi:MAG: CRISPR-associated protein Cas4 [Aggregatilineales bacterium]
MLDNKIPYFTITDLKQYMYCPRIFYYHACLPDVRPVTRKMRHGITAHELEQKRAAQRTLHQYHTMTGTRHFDVAVLSEKLRLSGQIDEVVETDTGMFPVDYKLAKRAGYHFKIQLTAYAILLEESTGQPIKQGYLYLMRPREMVTVRFSKKLRQDVHNALVHMHEIAESEMMPAPAASPARCIDCEFRRFCNDV